ncbi:MAG: hypothetical protein ACXWV0_03365 [Flavisolibacter sp.]
MRLFYPVILFLLIACSNQTPAAKEASFTFYPENPELVNFYDGWKESLVKDCRMLNLPVLFSGTDSFELRIWYWMAFDPHKRVLRFKLDSLGWKGTNYYSYSMTVKDQDGNNLKAPDPLKIGSEIFLAKSIIPTSGWKNFADSIEISGIKTLPTEEDIKNYKNRTFLDGHGYIIEVATKNTYRLLRYNLPDICDYEECKKLMRFIAMLENEFSMDYCWPNCHLVGRLSNGTMQIKNSR